MSSFPLQFQIHFLKKVPIINILLCLNGLYLVFIAFNGLYRKSSTPIDFLSKNTLKDLVIEEFEFMLAVKKYTDNMEKTRKMIKAYMEDYIVTVNQLPGQPYIIYNNESMDPQLQETTEEMMKEVIRHPFKSFQILVRLAHSLPNIEIQIEQLETSANEFLNDLQIRREDNRLPHSKTLADSIAALLDIQQAFDIPIEDMDLAGIDLLSNLSPQDCYQIGAFAMENHHFAPAYEFFQHGIHIINSSRKASIKGAEGIAEHAVYHNLLVLKQTELFLRSNHGSPLVRQVNLEL